MRGVDRRTEELFSYVSCEGRVPAAHPLRAILRGADAVLVALSVDFQQLYALNGRPSIAPEKLLRALLLQAFYSVRSERQLMEQLDYNLLFRMFIGLGVDDPVWDVTVFTKNRDRLLEGGRVSEATGTAEPDMAEMMLAAVPGRHAVTVGNDKGFDTAGFVAALREVKVTPHVGQDTSNRRSAVDARMTRLPGYAVSQRIRKRIEEAFGWIKDITLQPRARHRGKDQ